jgi:hypothetical protein
MADKYFVNFTPHDLVFYLADNTKVTIPKSGKVLTIAGNTEVEVIEHVAGIPIYDVLEKTGIQGVTWEELVGAKNVIVSTMAAEFLASPAIIGDSFFAVYAPSTVREHQVRDEKGAIIGMRALQRYC